MKNEAATILPTIAFAVSGILAARIIIIYNLRLLRATKRLKRAYAAVGRDWDYMPDFPLRIRLFCQPESIREESDSPDIRGAKEELITCRAEMSQSIWKAIKIMLWGFAAIILLGLVESGIRHFL